MSRDVSLADAAIVATGGEHAGINVFVEKLSKIDTFWPVAAEAHESAF